MKSTQLLQTNTGTITTSALETDVTLLSHPVVIPSPTKGCVIRLKAFGNFKSPVRAEGEGVLMGLRIGNQDFGFRFNNNDEARWGLEVVAVMQPSGDVDGFVNSYLSFNNEYNSDPFKGTVDVTQPLTVDFHGKLEGTFEASIECSMAIIEVIA